MDGGRPIAWVGIRWSDLALDTLAAVADLLEAIEEEPVLVSDEIRDRAADVDACLWAGKRAEG